MSVVQPVIWHGDGREHVLLEHILGMSNLAGHPEAILSAIDKWSAENKILMTIGAGRGNLILDIIFQDKPKVMVELGGYVGYSAIKFGQALRDVGGQRYLSLEANLEYADIARSMIRLAGLDDFVQIIVGPSARSLGDLAISDPSLKIDILFIDHSGRLYDQDLKLAEKHSLLSRHAAIIADNVLDPNASNYVARMQEHERPAHSKGAVTTGTGEEYLYESRVIDFELQSGEPDKIMISRRI